MFVFAWGRGEDGQLGLSDTRDQESPKKVMSLREVIRDDEVDEVVCGSGHSGVLTKSGKFYTWGRGDDGRLGHGDNEWQPIPTLISALLPHAIASVTCGSYHTAAVTRLGFLFTWGGGMYGKLGHGNEQGSNTPRRVETLENVREVGCGSRHTVCICGDNKVFAWGEKRAGITGLGPSHRMGNQTIPDQISSNYFTVPLSMVSASRQSASLTSDTDRLLGSHERNYNFAGESDLEFSIKKLAVCGFHSAIVTNSGELFTWGEGKFGRLGRGTDDDDYFPRIVPRSFFNNEDIVDASCGGFHTTVITKSGIIYVWGGGEHGQLGLGTRENCYTPTPIDSSLFLAHVNWENMSADGSQQQESSEIIDHSPRRNVEVKTVNVVCGWSHTACLTNLRRSDVQNVEWNLVYTWGNCDHGKLGHGTRATEVTPRVIVELYGKNIIKLATYNEHTLALSDPDSVATKKRTQIESTILQDFAMLRNNPDFADVVFEVEGREIYAHKCILAARSDHFRAMFAERYNFMEAKQTRIKPYDQSFGGGGPQITYDVFNALVEYIYTDHIKEVEGLRNVEDKYSSTLINLYATADMYSLENLKTLCNKHITRALNSRTAALLLKSASDCGASELKTTLLQYIVNNFEVVSKSESFGLLDKDLIVEILRAR